SGAGVAGAGGDVAVAGRGFADDGVSRGLAGCIQRTTRSGAARWGERVASAGACGAAGVAKHDGVCGDGDDDSVVPVVCAAVSDDAWRAGGSDAVARAVYL